MGFFSGGVLGEQSSCDIGGLSAGPVAKPCIESKKEHSVTVGKMNLHLRCNRLQRATTPAELQAAANKQEPTGHRYLLCTNRRTDDPQFWQHGSVCNIASSTNPMTKLLKRPWTTPFLALNVRDLCPTTAPVQCYDLNTPNVDWCRYRTTASDLELLLLLTVRLPEFPRNEACVDFRSGLEFCAPRSMTLLRNPLDFNPTCLKLVAVEIPAKKSSVECDLSLDNITEMCWLLLFSSGLKNSLSLSLSLLT